MAGHRDKRPANPPVGQRELRRVMEAAVANHRKGNLGSAIKGYRRALDLHPHFPEAHNNLAVALRAAGQAEEAADSYRRALALRPRYPAAHANLASTLAALGQHQSAVRHALEALHLDPGNPGHRRVLATTLTTMRFREASPAIVRAVEACFQETGIEHQTIVPAALSLLRLNPAIRSALEIADRGDDDLMSALTAGSLRGLFEDRLLSAVLTRGLVPDDRFEGLFSALRRCCLSHVVRAEAPPAGLFHEDPAFIAALACQCFINDYTYPETADEAALVARLPERLTAARAAPERVVWAMYRPLGELAALAEHGGRPTDLPPALEALFRIQIDEPATERRLEQDLAALTAIDDPVSGAVRQQYEANPYPRWLSTGTKTTRPLAEVVASLFPHDKRVRRTAPAPTRILVAGCGTGKHAADVATRYSASEVLAIDLSRRSLAYAARKAGEAKLGNLTFAQADILELGSLGRRFDLIEAVGVLHHLEDPLRGWRALLPLLAPDGFMKIGLYSTRARRFISAARDFVRDGGFPADARGIRSARQAILSLEPDDAVRKIAGELDFYSLSGCRDLLFNVQERSYELPEVAEALDRLGLAFVGFEIVDPEAVAAYRERYPEDPSLTDLELWHAFEAAAPDTFHNMYQFWCRKA